MAEEKETKGDKEDKKDYEIMPEDFQNFDLSYKIIVIGDSGVGKSCLTMKATKNYFENYYSPTVGFEFFTFNVKINDKFIRLQIWDTCGQEIYRSLITGFYRNSSLAILVYAIDSKPSFDNMESWLNDTKTLGNPNVKIFMIGNKIDLDTKRAVTNEEGTNFCKQHGLDKFFETSAKTGFNAQKVFVEAARILYEENLKLKDKCIRLQIWDTCGQEVYRSLITGFYRNSSLAILVYAIDNKQSFENIECWLNEVKTLGNPNVKIFFFFFKVELELKRAITVEQGKNYTKQHALDQFYETSAKTGFNAQKVFVEAAKLLYEEHLKCKDKANNANLSNGSIDFGPDNPNLFIVDEEEKHVYNKKKCCL